METKSIANAIAFKSKKEWQLYVAIVITKERAIAKERTRNKRSKGYQERYIYREE